MLELSIVLSAGLMLAFCISTACYEMRRSRCVSLNCCGCKIQRTLMTQESMALDERPQLQNAMNMGMNMKQTV